MWIDPQVLKLWKCFWINYVLHPSTPYFQTNPGWGKICPKSLGVHHKGNWDHVYPSLRSGPYTIKLDQIGNMTHLRYPICIYKYIYQPDPTSLPTRSHRSTRGCHQLHGKLGAHRGLIFFGFRSIPPREKLRCIPTGQAGFTSLCTVWKFKRCTSSLLPHNPSFTSPRNCCWVLCCIY